MPHATSLDQTVSIGVACTKPNDAQRPGDLIEAARRRGCNAVVEHGFVWMTDGAGTVVLARLQLAIEFVLGNDPVASGSLGEIERAIASLDQIRHRLAELKLSNPDRDRDAGKNLPGRAAGDATLRD
jgi:hypothetical protein